ncbi:uncharacterized protein LOC112143711 [Oryzias melastigma]|uniref:uncharacterized protein LOC112143711 n=1 Tax=Oryzias melastigma TaxID=30732 RepID=UPI00168CDEA3|nr:uncharacterized protein LOC112143711 [Oryzias melastigma]
MKTCEGFFHLLLWLIFITLLPVLWAQKNEVLSQVTGHVDHNVTLPCSLIQGTDFSNVTQSQWEFLSPDGNKTLIMVSSKQHGKTVHESHLKGRVDMEDQSLIIKNVELSDAGSYICTVTSFPDGPSQKNIYLHVSFQEHEPMSTGIVAAIVSGSVLLLLIALSGAAYCIVSRRHNHLGRVQVRVDSFRSTAATIRPSFLRTQDVVYSDVKLKGVQFGASSFDDKPRVSTQVDDVTYSEVTVLRPTSFHV